MASSPDELDDSESPLPSPSSPTDPTASSTTSPRPQLPAFAMSSPSVSVSVPNMTTSSTPLGNVNAARGKPPSAQQPMAARGGALFNNPDIAARVKALSLQRSGPPPANSGRSPAGPGTPTPDAPSGPTTGFPANFKLPPGLNRPHVQSSISSPAVTGASRGPSLAEKRGMKLPGGLPGQPASPNLGPRTGRPKPSMKLSDMAGGTNGGANGGAPAQQREQSDMEKYAEYIDTKNGAITFKGQATVTGEGIEFASGRTYKISLDEVDRLGEPLGKGNYGTVYRVRHSRPKFRRPGQGLAHSKAIAADEEPPNSPTRHAIDSAKADGTTGVVMAMKEMRLELDDAKFRSIIMELDILHKCISPYIVDFYGAFFQEGAVYICMEFMDGGSIDKVYGDGVPENVLRKITLSTTLGLKSLKEEHNIIHRDVKPTNILLNTRGQVKICDFGVSGNLVASIAKTNIGCQSYMAPERISSGGVAQAGANPGGGTYSVQSDIWSLGLTIIECAMGRYPYPPETYDNIFSQLAAIVDGEPPDLPADSFSDAARDFVAGCLNKIPNLRPTYPMLLQHAWLAPFVKPETILEEDEEAAETASSHDFQPTIPDEDGFVDREVGEWVIQALDRKAKGLMGKSVKPALHAAPLDTIGSPSETKPLAVDA